MLVAPAAVYAQSFVSLWDQPNATPYSTSDPVPVSLSGGSGGTSTQAQVTSVTGNVPNSSTTITLTHASTHLVIKTDPAAAVVYVDLNNGTATNADFRIDPGAGLALDFLPSFSAIKILGASATGTYSVAAW